MITLHKRTRYYRERKNKRVEDIHINVQKNGYL